MSSLRQDGIALDEVEPPVRIGLLIVIQTVEVEHFQQGGLLESILWYVTEAHTSSVAQILDVHLELFSLYRHGFQAIDVLHHQVPVRNLGRTRCVFQQFYEQCLVVVFLVCGKLSDLVGLSIVGVFVCHRQHLVGLECVLQGYIS